LTGRGFPDKNFGFTGEFSMIKNGLKKAFNWFADGPRNPWTATQFFTCWEYHLYKDWLGRGGRLAERGMTLPAFYIAVTTGLATGGLTGFAAGVGIAIMGMAGGALVGKITDAGFNSVAKKLDPQRGLPPPL
jgi:hypothetical protein